MWKNIVEADKLQMEKWHMRIECWIPKATNTHSRYLLLFQATQFMNRRGLLIFTLSGSICWYGFFCVQVSTQLLMELLHWRNTPAKHSFMIHRPVFSLYYGFCDKSGVCSAPLWYSPDMACHSHDRQSSGNFKPICITIFHFHGLCFTCVPVCYTTLSGLCLFWRYIKPFLFDEPSLVTEQTWT